MAEAGKGLCKSSGPVPRPSRATLGRLPRIVRNRPTTEEPYKDVFVYL